MEARLAVMSDLPQIKDMYQEIIENMNENGIRIWDEIYPCEFFQNDIENNQLYLLEGFNEIFAAFALCRSNPGSKKVRWAGRHASALYIDRLGVNVNYLKRGIASIAIEKAVQLSKAAGAEYLRLFVVDENYPAIRLYEKNGFQKAIGIYDEVICENLILHEFGYERKL